MRLSDLPIALTMFGISSARLALICARNGEQVLLRDEWGRDTIVTLILVSP
jgi:hypothetical protein